MSSECLHSVGCQRKEMKHMKIEKSIFGSRSTLQTSRGRKWKKKEEQSLKSASRDIDWNHWLTRISSAHASLPLWKSYNIQACKDTEYFRSCDEAEEEEEEERNWQAHLKEELIGLRLLLLHLLKYTTKYDNAAADVPQWCLGVFQRPRLVAETIDCSWN